MDTAIQASGYTQHQTWGYPSRNLYYNCPYGQAWVGKGQGRVVLQHGHDQATRILGQGDALRVVQDGGLQRAQLECLGLACEYLRLQIELLRRAMNPPQEKEPPTGMYG